ncbi:MAG: DinB family protein [Planctomycetota bacterium]
MKKQDFIDIIRKTQTPLFNMVEMIPDDKLDWAPGDGFMNVGQVIKHLSENWCIVKMMVTQEWPFTDPSEMAEMMKLENIPSCTKAEALAAMKKDLDESIAYIENELSDEDFFNKVVEAPWGFKGEIWKAVLMANDHQGNHKMQLHIYLKQLGQPVSTETLYGM